MKITESLKGIVPISLNETILIVSFYLEIGLELDYF